MKLIRGALIGAATLALAAAPAVASADASKLSLRAATESSDASGAVPKIPYWLAGTLVAGVLVGTVILATESPDSP